MFSLTAPKETKRIPSKPKTSPKPHISQAKDGKLLSMLISSTVTGLKSIYEQLFRHLSQLKHNGILCSPVHSVIYLQFSVLQKYCNIHWVFFIMQKNAWQQDENFVVKFRLQW